MPEMPEVEAVCRKLRAEAVGRRIRAVKISRCATPAVAELAAGKSIKAVDRKGKHILIRLSGSITVHVHLRMTGNLFWVPDHRFHTARARVVFELSDLSGVIYEDPRALGKLHAAPSDEVDEGLGEIGPEPLTPEFTWARFHETARASRQPAKLFLMDQTKVAGLGNIYAAEALFRAKVNPKRSMCRIGKPKLESLFGAILEVLGDAVQSAERAYSGPGEFGEAESFPLAVYDREGEACDVCGRTVRRIRQGGRSTYYCPSCQR
ncbi:MAG: bifunctional DNA-formamidopyrimidine glycosylase/DNA-(apurinic or apyrimidinic site) lyase [Bryobacteraceae bacterium]